MPGEVVACVEDSHQFSSLELSEARWRIVSIPGVGADAFCMLLIGDGMARRSVRFALRDTGLLDGDGVLTLSAQEALDLVSLIEVDDAN